MGTLRDGQQGRGRVRYEAEIDPGFADEIMGMPGGEKLLSCIQCGTCSGTCPVSPYMDYTPRRIIAMIRAGFKEDVLGCLTIWLCASCYACSADCPKEIRITDIMYSLKQKAMEGKAYPKRFPIVVLARRFFRMVSKRGRNSEGRLILDVFLRTNPLQLLSMAGLGLRLMWTGRFPLRADSIRHPGGLRALLQAVTVPGKTA